MSKVIGMICDKILFHKKKVVGLLLLLVIISACSKESIVTVMDRAMPVSRVVIDLGENESLIVDKARVIVFDRDGDKVSNTLLDVANDNINVMDGVYKLTLTSNEFQARLGNNHVYVVLNEDTGGDAIVSRLNAVSTASEMEEIRKLPVSYTGLMEVVDGTEPPFLMCVHDKVNISSASSSIDMTGLETDSYGFSMRRTMAKVVLESIWGGVKPDGRILNTNILYNPNLDADQTGNTDVVTIDVNGKMTGGNVNLAATSELFVNKVELVNVPNEYSWVQEKDDSQYASPYIGGYLAAQDISLGFMPNGNYLKRTWPGRIVANGKIDFSRTDRFPVFYKQVPNQGVNSYDIQEAYPFDYEPDPYGHDAEFNSGNFIPWVKALYAGDRIIEGEIIPKLETMRLTSNVDPAAWSLNGSGMAYYIPENIAENPQKQTMLRVHFSIGLVTAEVDEEIIKKIIDESLNGKNDASIPMIKEDGTEVVITGKDVSEVIKRAKVVENLSIIGDGILADGSNVGSSKDQKWGICYDGINAIWHGKDVAITNQIGYYYVDVENASRNLYIDVPLSNYVDGTDVGANDHNIYRGREYKVKLFVTKQGGSWPGSSRNSEVTSRSFYLGEEEFEVMASITVTPIE